MFNFLSGMAKLAVMSLVTGAVLSAMNLPTGSVLAIVGLTPERLELVQRGVSWAIPNFILGTLIVLPLWLVVFLLTPPRG